MEHKITEEEIRSQCVAKTVVSSSNASTKEAKDLRVVVENDTIYYIVRYFKDGELKVASKPLYILTLAVDAYNTL
jgi:hypothetical protein